MLAGQLEIWLALAKNNEQIAMKFYEGIWGHGGGKRTSD